MNEDLLYIQVLMVGSSGVAPVNITLTRPLPPGTVHPSHNSSSGNLSSPNLVYQFSPRDLATTTVLYQISTMGNFTDDQDDFGTAMNFSFSRISLSTEAPVLPTAGNPLPFWNPNNSSRPTLKPDDLRGLVHWETTTNGSIVVAKLSTTTVGARFKDDFVRVDNNAGQRNESVGIESKRGFALEEGKTSLYVFA
jgi:hypothetical protein